MRPKYFHRKTYKPSNSSYSSYNSKKNNETVSEDGPSPLIKKNTGSNILKQTSVQSRDAHPYSTNELSLSGDRRAVSHQKDRSLSNNKITKIDSIKAISHSTNFTTNNKNFRNSPKKSGKLNNVLVTPSESAMNKKSNAQSQAILNDVEASKAKLHRKTFSGIVSQPVSNKNLPLYACEKLPLQNLQSSRVNKPGPIEGDKEPLTKYLSNTCSSIDIEDNPFVAEVESSKLSTNR